MKAIYILFSLICINICLYAQDRTDYKYLDLSSSPFQVDEDYLSKHDIVYLSPTQLEAEGFPMGNGNMGGMIWNNNNGIELQINKNDLWSKPSKEEDGLSVLKHAARLKIDFGLPVFSWIHLKGFEGRLSLQKGEATYKASTPFSTTTIRTWLTHDSNVWVLECENLQEQEQNLHQQHLPNIETEQKATVSLERIGSRSFSGWYGGWFPKDPAVGIGRTHTLLNNNDMIIEETGDGLHFAVACRILKEPIPAVIINSHRMEQKTTKSKFAVLISVVTNRENDSPAIAAQKLLDEAEARGIEQLKANKDSWYKKFWSSAFMKLGDDYLENIYYLRRYLMAAGSQGQFPVAFNGGLWRWNRDVMNWVTPHHWNTQQQYWGLCAQNDCQLMLPYLNTYFNMIPSGEILAKENGAAEDALLLTEAHCFTGEQTSKNWEDMKHNFTPASQVASLFWDYYAFTGDKEFLKNKAYIFMRKAANFYLQKLQWDKEKKEYHLLSSLHESADINYVKNTISDRNCIEQLFKNCIQAATLLKTDNNKVSQWKHVLKHLWKVSYESFEECGEVISAAEEYYTEKRYSPWMWASGGSIAFPAGLIGINDKDSRMGKAVANLLKCRDYANAHYPLPEIAARMGLGDEALKYIVNGVNIHQMYPQGLMHNVTGYPDNIYNLQSVHDLLGHTYTIRSHDFFQCGMEPISNYCTAINEMMLQSNENKIRVFPAIPTTWNTTRIAFTLLARGAFIVSSERDEQAKVTRIGIKSLKGNICKVHNPWPINDVVVLTANSREKVKFKIEKDNVITFTTIPDTEYIIKLNSDKMVKVPTIYSGAPNNKVKRWGKRTLGKDSGWNDSVTRD